MLDTLSREDVAETECAKTTEQHTAYLSKTCSIYGENLKEMFLLCSSLIETRRTILHCNAAVVSFSLPRKTLEEL